MERLIICGGGHVGLEVAFMASRLEYEIIVIDDREEFVSESRFPMAAQRLCMPFLDALEQLGSREDDYYVLVTRGHAFDRECLEKVLGGNFAYVGMIGSRGKVKAVKESLLRAGVLPEILEQVHAPIGLPIGGQTPAEIAVSIAAQLVQERARLGTAVSDPPQQPGVLCTIIKKSGSAPRGVGAWMHVAPDGTVSGTIGGGAVESQATLDAMELWRSGGGKLRKLYDMSPGAGDLGMVCGGKIEVELRTIHE